MELVDTKNSDWGYGKLSDIKKRILETAIEAFARYGYDGISLRTIAQEVGINHQNITHYFGSKEDLWEAALQMEIERFVDLGGPIDPPSNQDEWKENFREVTYKSLQSISKHSTLFRIYCHEGMRNGSRYEKLLKTTIKQHEDFIKGYMLKVKEAGILKDIPFDELLQMHKAAMVYRYLVPAEFRFLTGREVDDPESIKAHAKAITELFLK